MKEFIFNSIFPLDNKPILYLPFCDMGSVLEITKYSAYKPVLSMVS
jgi:hypothetical protein